MTLTPLCFLVLEKVESDFLSYVIYKNGDFPGSRKRARQI